MTDEHSWETCLLGNTPEAGTGLPPVGPEASGLLVLEGRDWLEAHEEQARLQAAPP